MSTIVFQPQDKAQMAFLTDFAKRISVPYVIVPLDVQALLNREERQAQKRSIEVSPRVANLLSGHSWDIPDEDLDDIRYKYLAEKYK